MLIPIVIAGLVIEVLCIRIASLGDIMQHIPRFSLMYSTAFVAYLFAVFLVSKNAALSGEEQQHFQKYYLDHSCFFFGISPDVIACYTSNDIFPVPMGRKDTITWDQSLFPTACIFKPGTS